MSYARQMIETAPAPVTGDTGSLEVDPLVACIEACLDCAQACTACADACLDEEMVADLRRCIRLNADCADVCATTAAVMSRTGAGTEEVRQAMLAACAEVCRRCAEECESHASMHEHCAVCAEACRRCEAACQALLA